MYLFIYKIFKSTSLYESKIKFIQMIYFSRLLSNKLTHKIISQIFNFKNNCNIEKNISF